MHVCIRWSVLTGGTTMKVLEKYSRNTRKTRIANITTQFRAESKGRIMLFDILNSQLVVQVVFLEVARVHVLFRCFRVQRDWRERGYEKQCCSWRSCGSQSLGALLPWTNAAYFAKTSKTIWWTENFSWNLNSAHTVMLVLHGWSSMHVFCAHTAEKSTDDKCYVISALCSWMADLYRESSCRAH